MQGLGRSHESRKALLDNATRAIRAAGTRVSFDSTAPSEQHAQDEEEVAEPKEHPPLPSSNWTRDDPVPVVLDTFKAAVNWLEAASPLHRSADVATQQLCWQPGLGFSMQHRSEDLESASP